MAEARACEVSEGSLRGPLKTVWGYWYFIKNYSSEAPALWGQLKLLSWDEDSAVIKNRPPSLR